MILDSMKNKQNYIEINPQFKKAFAFLERKDLHHLPLGQHTITNTMYAIIIETEQSNQGEYELESHQKYIDLHFTLKGKDKIGWKPTIDCLSPSIYDINSDSITYTDKIDIFVPVAENQYAIFFPNDAHAPLTGIGKIKKLSLYGLRCD